MVPLVQHHRLLGFIAMMDEPIHHLQIKPWYPDLINTRFIIFDRENQHYDGVNGNFEYLTYLKFNASFLKRKANNYDKIYFITHGFQEFFMGDYVRLKDALLDFQATTNPAVIVVDWSDGSMYGRKMVNNAELDKTTYGQAAVNTMVVGREVGLLSYMLCVLEYIAREDIHYIGFDLGAHVMHFAGQWFSYLVDRIKERDSTPRRTGKVGRITGLDPSARDFQGYGTAAKLPYLSALDADFVDIMHTSSVRNNGDNDDVKNHRLGMSALSGHVDVYPNGGQEQPFCNNKPKCSHRRALHYFIASLSNDVDIKMSLTAFGADSYQEYIAIKTGIPAPTSLMSMFKRKQSKPAFIA
ncbi:Pancreatic lipase-related protein 2 [Halotydeus destructor]|nr:Pancreatic lipase-related protein 2 [Halotydeus destructor]